MTAALLAIASAQLALFTLVCGAILWELRRARHEANTRGELGKALLEEGLDEQREQQAIALALEEQVRRTRQAAEAR